jgi:hypothetical protein
VSAQPDDLISQHLDAVPARHRFSGVRFGLVEWDLTHLDPFAFQEEIEPGLLVDVVVLFACHCFAHDEKDDPRRGAIPPSEYYRDGREVRVLDPDRYELSRQLLPRLIQSLAVRDIRVEGPPYNNFFTVEVTTAGGLPGQYMVFFDVTNDKGRKKRLILRVQSAYPVAALKSRQAKAGKVKFRTLLRAAYLGNKIRG